MDVFRLVNEVILHANRLASTAAVDDDYPSVKRDFDNAVLVYAKYLSVPRYVSGERVYLLIATELEKAKRKFPKWPTNAVHAAAVVCEESGELIRAALQHQDEGGPLDACDKEAIQTAAMCVRFLERM